jgi:hypothetical protein
MTKAPRREGDFYPTPQAVADRIVAATFVEPGPVRVQRILEPSAGDGAFVHACRARFPQAMITAVEPTHVPDHDPDRVFRGTIEDYARATSGRFDLIIGNPPYNLAAKHVRLCLNLLAPYGRLVFLLRLGFLASKGRRLLFQEHVPERVDVLPARPSFSWTWTCPPKFGGCGHKEVTAPDVARPHCKACGRVSPTCTKTDSHDYAVITWRQGFEGETAMGWLP